MKRLYGVWCEYSHDDSTGKYTIDVAVGMSHSGYNVVLFNTYGESHKYKYDSIADMTIDILYACKSRGYYIKWYREVGARWYEIWFKNTATTAQPDYNRSIWNRYGITEEYIQLANSEHRNKITHMGEYK